MTRRGQTLMLFALSVVLLTLAVMMCLSLTATMRSKMQLQVAADAAAYSESVATARTFNSIALMNRAQAASMVALTGVQSAASYAGTFFAVRSAAAHAYRLEWTREYCDGPATASVPTESPCTIESWAPFFELVNGSSSTPTCRSGGRAGRVNGDFVARKNRIEASQRFDLFVAPDEAAGAQALAIDVEANAWAAREKTTLAGLQTQLPALVDAILSRGGATASSRGVTARELGSAVAPGSVSAAVAIAMGSRAHPFVTNRADGERVLSEALQRVVGASGNEIVVTGFKGLGYLAATRNHGAAASDEAAWGDDHGVVRVNYQGPNAGLGDTGRWHQADFYGWASTTDQQDRSDSHSWCPIMSPETRAPDSHPLLPHPTRPADVCPGSSCIWPEFIDVDPATLNNAIDAFGQPKLQLTAVADAEPEHPWSIRLSERFAARGPGATLDVTDQRALAGVTPSRQTLSTAMAYYHRPGHWKEPPNLWNPFWRATLVRADIDDPTLSDARVSLTAARADWASEALRKLMAVGYRGIP